MGYLYPNILLNNVGSIYRVLSELHHIRLIRSPKAQATIPFEPSLFLFKMLSFFKKRFDKNYEVNYLRLLSAWIAAFI